MPMLIAAEQIVGTADAAGPVPGPGFVDLSDGVISRAGAGRPPAEPDIALPDGYLVPGLVDLQINGYYGTEFQAADAAAWAAVARRLPETGTTSFAPTLITAPVAV
ncbi:MAG: N-acetylglucosamine-6-phosphate deacetylase, partial [Streptosporangiaceae bacterium]